VRFLKHLLLPNISEPAQTKLLLDRFRIDAIPGVLAPAATPEKQFAGAVKSDCSDGSRKSDTLEMTAATSSENNSHVP
jgi:hypothetical protein